MFETGETCFFLGDVHLNVYTPSLSNIMRSHDTLNAGLAHYRGSEEYGIVALQLMDWLIGDNVPHPYDYTLCGRVA